MTTLHQECPQRKSSVYNQTGQNYFEQLSAYNRMSSHLRRVLMAQCVVDSRNKKYVRDKRLASRQTDYSKSLDQILARKEFIDDVAYDTQHHPADLLRMRLDCNSNCGGRTRRKILEHTHKCCNIRCSSASPKTARRETGQSLEPRRFRANNAQHGASIELPYRYSARSAVSTYRRIQQPEVDVLRQKNGGEMARNSQNGRNHNFEAINESYSYDSSFESISDGSEMELPIAKNKLNEALTHDVADTDHVTIPASRKFKKVSSLVDSSEEAKYSKFLYDITQEILVHGLYTDRELEQIFKKHVEMNLNNLDRDRMLLEINQLKSTLNVKEYLENEKGVKCCVCPRKFATSTPLKYPKRQSQDERSLIDRTDQKSKISNGQKNLFLLVESNPEMLINQQDMLVTLMEMKLDPKQVQNICKSLQDKSKGTTFDDNKYGTVDFQDRTTQAIVMEAKKPQNVCMCQCREEYMARDTVSKEIKSTIIPSTKELQTDREKIEMGIQTPVMIDSRGISTSKSLERMNSKDGKKHSSKGMESTERSIANKDSYLILRSPRENDESERISEESIDQSDDSENVGDSDVYKRSIDSKIPGESKKVSLASEKKSAGSVKLGRPESKKSVNSKISEDPEKISYTSKKGPGSVRLELFESKKPSIASKTSGDPGKMSLASEKKSAGSVKLEQPESKKPSMISKTSKDPGKISQTSEKKSTCSVKLEFPEYKKPSMISKTSKDPGKMSQSSEKKSACSVKLEFPESKKPSMISKTSKDPGKMSQASEKKSTCSVKLEFPEYKKPSMASKISKDPAKISVVCDKKSAGSVKLDSKKSSVVTKASERSLRQKSSADPVESSKKSSTDSKGIGTEYSAESDGTMTEIVTEDKSVETKYNERIHEITDDELASLPEDISETEESQADDSSHDEKLAQRKTFETKELQIVNELDEDSSTGTHVDPHTRRSTKKSGKSDSEAMKEKIERHSKYEADKKHSKSSSASKRSTRQTKVDEDDESIESQGESTQADLNKEPKMHAVSGGNLSAKRSTTRSTVSLSSIEKNDYEYESAKNKSPRVCNPCWGYLRGQSTRHIESTTSLDVPTICVKRIINPARSMTTASDLSLLNKENIDDASFRENTSMMNETRDSRVVSERESKSLPWMHIERGESASKHSDLNPSRPEESIPRKASLMQSMKMAVASLKRRKTTSSEEKKEFAISQKFPEETSIPSTESREEHREMMEKSLELNEPSEYSSSRSSGGHRSKENPRVTIQEERVPRIASSNASTSTRGDFDYSDDDEKPFPIVMNRCMPDCRGYRSKLNRCNVNTNSSAMRALGLTISIPSMDSVQDEEN